MHYHCHAESVAAAVARLLIKLPQFGDRQRADGHAQTHSQVEQGGAAGVEQRVGARVPRDDALREQLDVEAQLLQTRGRVRQLHDVWARVRGRNVMVIFGFEVGAAAVSLTEGQSDGPDEADRAHGAHVGGHVAQRIADRVPAVDRDEGERQHGHGHRDVLGMTNGNISLNRSVWLNTL